jgi:integrase
MNKYHNFTVLLKEYEKDRVEKAPQSYKSDVYYLSDYVFDFYLTKNEHNIVALWHEFFDDFRHWLIGAETTHNKRSTDKLAYSSMNNCIKALNTFLRFVYHKDKMGDPPKCPVYPKDKLNRKGLESVISRDEEQFVFDRLVKIEKRSAIFWRTLIATAMRISEGLGLSIADIFKGAPTSSPIFTDALKRHGIQCYGYIVLRDQPALPTIRDKTNHVSRKPLKGRKKIDPKFNRTIPIIDQDVWQLILEMFKEQKENWEKKKFGLEKRDYLLFNGLTKSVFSNDLRLAYEKSSFTPHTPHDVRHTGCTAWARLTFGDHFLCQHILGHKDPEETQRYLHLWEEIQRDLETEQALLDDNFLDDLANINRL